ncbi:ParD-like family protein [Legionella sp. 31fI33]|nr:ParD-like family protein [Legionella sp. 31fI33]MCC5013830.1 ParD-like family protein [Legionella sp. 31fI33]
MFDKKGKKAFRSHFYRIKTPFAVSFHYSSQPSTLFQNVALYSKILYYWFFGENMGIVKISDELHEATKVMARAMSRSINSQAEYWIRIGKMAEENPSITYSEILKILINQASSGEIRDVSEDF